MVVVLVCDIAGSTEGEGGGPRLCEDCRGVGWADASGTQHFKQGKAFVGKKRRGRLTVYKISSQNN